MREGEEEREGVEENVIFEQHTSLRTLMMTRQGEEVRQPTVHCSVGCRAIKMT